MSAARALIRYSVFALCLAAPLAFAQGGGGQTGGAGGGSGTKSAPSIPRGSTTQRQPPQERRPIFLRGRVMLDDGTQPTERVAIERVCNGRVRREAYTDSHGSFSFQLGADLQVFQDASESGFDPARPGFVGANSGTSSSGTGGLPSGFSSRDLMSCELRASLPGFRSDSIALASVQLFEESEIGPIVLHRMGKVEGSLISMTTLKAPKEAKKAFEHGNHLLKQHKQAEAGAEFSKAVTLYPTYAEAMVKLGEISVEQGRAGDAEKLFQQAIAADSRFMPPYFDLALIAARNQDWKQMVDVTDRALALNAYEYPAMYYYNAVANYNLHKLDVAEKSARSARRLDSQYHIPKIDLVLANILLQRGDYGGAAEHLRSFLKYTPTGADADAARELLERTEQRTATGPAAQR
jgi:tetratricopeptide (TPR) repeat protein